MSNIPNITDICGTVTQALAETIRNREAIIAELREENARAQNLLRERCINNASLIMENTDLRGEVEGWKLECETNALDEKELYRLRAEVQSLRNQLVVSQNSQSNCDKQCKILRDEARREIMNSAIDQACSNEEIEEEYRKRGWSYLKKENTND